MSSTPPVSFQTLAQTAGNPASGGYPYQIRGSDLDKNFVFATLDVEDGLIEQTTGAGGHPQRRLKIPAQESTTKQNLTAQSGVMEWADAIPDGQAEGQFLRWNAAAGAWRLFPNDIPAAKKGAFPQWTQDGWKALGEGTAKGQFLKWDNTLKQWVKFSGTAEGAFPQWHATNGWESQGAGTAKGQFLKWDAVAKNWIPFSGSAEGNFPQWNQVDGWVDTGAGIVDGQLMKWDATTKKWVPGPMGTLNNELLRWNAEGNTWEAFGRGSIDGQLLVAQSGGWVQFQAPPSSGTHVLGAVNGVLQWIATEEC